MWVRGLSDGDSPEAHDSEGTSTRGGRGRGIAIALAATLLLGFSLSGLASAPNPWETPVDFGNDGEAGSFSSMPGTPPSVRPSAIVSFSLYGSASGGWGFTASTLTSPGPTLTVNQDDLVHLRLEGVDNAPHNFYVDYNGNQAPDGTEPKSPDFRGTTGPIDWSFTADSGGTFSYFCDYHQGSMYGTIIIQGPQIEGRVEAPWTQLALGQTMTVTVRAQVSGAALSGASVVVTATSGLSVSPASGTTGADGAFTTAVTANALGAQSATVAVSKSGLQTGTATLPVNVIEPLAMTAFVTSNRREMMSSETATIRVNLTSGLTGVTGAIVTRSTPLGGIFSSVREIGAGNYEFDWTAPTVTRQTFVPINVLAKAGGYLDAPGRVVILLDPDKTNLPDPTQLFLLVQAPATSLRVGQTMTVTVYVYTIEGYVVSGALLTLLRVGPGTVSVVTDRLNGEYTFVYTTPASVPSPTGVLITITASKLGYLNGTARLAITVTP